jgi:hypothetical protein
MRIESDESETGSETSRWRREIKAKLQEEENNQILMELQNRKYNGSTSEPNNGSVVGNGRIAHQFYPKMNGRNGNFYEREEQYETRSDV